MAASFGNVVTRKCSLNLLLSRKSVTFCRSMILSSRHDAKRMYYITKKISELCKVDARYLQTSPPVWKKKFQKYVPSRTKKKAAVIEIWKNMTVQHLSEQSNRSIDDIFEAMLYVEDCEDYSEVDSVIDDLNKIQKIANVLGYRCRIISVPTALATKEKPNKDATKRPPPDPSLLRKRPPVVTIMGHVDHGKTTLLDALRHTSVVEQEFGGITQHIGAFSVNLPNKESITFLDTPGHAAFSAMRARGAYVTDIVVLVVAADDGVMEQTIESIRYAREAKVPIIVAINKIDKPGIDIEFVKRGLLSQGIQLEDMGGDVQAVQISALKGTNLEQLIDAILAQAELMEIKADPTGLVEGAVIESGADPGRGKQCTALIQRGTLRKGAVLVAGTAWAKIRAMFDEWSKPIQMAPPGTPVQLMGWKILPSAGDEILEVESEKRAREVVDWREDQLALKKQEKDAVVVQQKLDKHLQEYKAELKQRREEGRFRKRRTAKRKEAEETFQGPRLPFIIKGDVDGSVDAILDILDTYHSHEACRLDLLSYGVGPVTENDIELAEVFNGVIYAFNVKVLPSAVSLKKKVPIKEHNVIYHLIDDIKEEISNRLAHVDKEEILGEADILQEFLVTVGKSIVPVAGCRCIKGVLKKNALFRVIRGNDVLHEGKAASLRHLKNEVESIKKSTECGVRLQCESVRFQPGDTLICYQIVKEKQITNWDPGF